MSRRLVLGIGALIAFLVWAGSLVALLGSHWSLTCTVDGQPLGGIDCLQTWALPQSLSPVARSVGFVPLLVGWVAASVAILACVLLGWAARRPTPTRSCPGAWT